MPSSERLDQWFFLDAGGSGRCRARAIVEIFFALCKSCPAPLHYLTTPVSTWLPFLWRHDQKLVSGLFAFLHSPQRLGNPSFLFFLPGFRWALVSRVIRYRDSAKQDLSAAMTLPKTVENIYRWYFYWIPWHWWGLLWLIEHAFPAEVVVGHREGTEHASIQSI